MKKYLIIFSLVSFSAFANELPMTNYVKMQEALAADNFKDALVPFKTICEKELAKHKAAYKDCGKQFKNIDELRTSFKKLSEIYLAHGSKKDMEGLQKATCPMAEAKWVQKKGELANPYYGKSMLTCGEKI